MGMKSLALALLTATVVSGCGAGIIYTHTFQPLTIDQHGTRTSVTSGEGDIKHIQFSVVGVAWDDAAIGDIAKKNGMNEVYYADLEILRILTVWNRYTVHVYGK